MVDPFRLDRTAFHMGTHEETERYHAQNQPATFADRLKAAAYLNSIAFRYDVNTPPPLDRTAFSARKHNNG
jgi:hypothetical protein